MRPHPLPRKDQRTERLTKRIEEAAVIEAGDTLTNPVTKERMTFLKTATETKGEYVLIELRFQPDYAPAGEPASATA